MNKEKEQIPLPIELFGIECGKGWFDLLTPVIEYVNDYNKDKTEDKQIHFTQIKEKWGGLRIYVDFGTEELYKLIDEAEDESYNVCEECGSRENVGMRQTSWYTTMCLDCIKKVVKETKHPQRWCRNSDDKTFSINTDGSMEEILDMSQ